jgi:hypothetical protein
LPYASHRCARAASQGQKMHRTPLIFPSFLIVKFRTF